MKKDMLFLDQKHPNESCPKEDHPPALQPVHRDMIRLILRWVLRFPWVPIWLTKKGVAAGCRWLWLAIQDSFMFATDLPGVEFGLDRVITAIYLVLTFWWT